MFFRGAEAAVVVYDITDVRSFEGLRRWVDELKLYAAPNVTIAIVGNKCDLKDKRVS
jgi:GTPase SAR1 family protein